MTNTVIVAYIDTICNPYGKHICINTIWVPYDIAIGDITVKFQLRSSVNVRLTESSHYNRFCIERSPKWFFELLGVGPKIFRLNALGMQ